MTHVVILRRAVVLLGVVAAACSEGTCPGFCGAIRDSGCPDDTYEGCMERCERTHELYDEEGCLEELEDVSTCNQRGGVVCVEGRPQFRGGCHEEHDALDACMGW